MIGLAVDENFDHHILRALIRRLPDLDHRTVQAAGLFGADDETVLAWGPGKGPGRAVFYSRTTSTR